MIAYFNIVLRWEPSYESFNSVFQKYFSNTFQYSFVFLHTIYRNDVQNEFKSGMFKTEKIFKNIFRDWKLVSFSKSNVLGEF